MIYHNTFNVNIHSNQLFLCRHTCFIYEKKEEFSQRFIKKIIFHFSLPFVLYQPDEDAEVVAALTVVTSSAFFFLIVFSL